MVWGLGISKLDLEDTALLFAAIHAKPTFSAGDLSEFLGAQLYALHEEHCGELCDELVAARRLREIGPGVYAKVAGAK